MRNQAIIFLLTGVMLAGCKTTEQAFLEKGLNPLTGEEIRALVTGNTLSGEHMGGAYAIYFPGDGKMEGKVWWDEGTDSDHGTWEVTADNQYCRQWQVKWGNLERKCVRFYREGDKIHWVDTDGRAYAESSVTAGKSQFLIAEGSDGQFQGIQGQFLALKQLLDSGVIDKQEYETRKQATLDQVFGRAAPVGIAQRPAPAQAPAPLSEESKDLAFWKSVRDSERIEDFQAYLDKYPAGDFASLARNRIQQYISTASNREDAQFWNTVRDSDRPRDFEAYIGKFPNGQFAMIARNKLQRLAALENQRRDRQAWGTASAESSRAAYERYLVQYPGGRYAKLAETRLGELAALARGRAERDLWALVGRRNSWTGYQDYLAKYPNGLYANEAQGRLQQLAALAREREERELWNSVKNSRGAAELRSYLEQYPDGRFAAEAGTRLAILEKFAAVAGVNFGRYNALVIGINEYKYLPNLKTALSDARAVAKLLKRDYGFKVTLLEDPSRGDIVEAFDELRETLVYKDNLLIYYAGHGWLDEDADRGYWLAADAKPNRRTNWVSNATLADTLRSILAKHVMVVADSCFSGTLIRGANIGLKGGDYWRRMAEKQARVAITSGGLEPVADSSGGKNSPFATAFIRALQRNDAVIDGTALFGEIRRPVMIAAQQTPQYSDVRNAGHDGGDFLFIRKY